MDHSALKIFLRTLWRQGVELWLETDQLRFRGNKDALTSDCLSTLRENKSAILALLKKQPDAYLGFPLSEGQKAIHLQQSLAPSSCAYHLSTLLHLTDDLDKHALTTSLDLVLQRHAPLRMAIKTLDGVLAQQVSYSLPSVLTEENADDSLDLDVWAKVHAEQPFDLEQDALIKAILLKTPNNGYRLLFIAHHIVADFWALSLFLNELQQVYSATCNQQSADLPEIGKLYKDYVFSEQAYLNSEDSSAAKDYWHQLLTPAPNPLQLRTDIPRSAQTKFQGAERSHLLEPTLSLQIKDAAKKAGTSAFTWVLSAYQLLLHFYSRETHFGLGVPLIGRHDSDYQKIAGQFTNPACFVADFTQTTDFEALLQRNKTQLQQAMGFQRYPLQRLVDELNLPRDTAQNPLFQCAFSWNQMQEQAQQGQLIQSVLSMKQQGAIYDLVLTGFDQEEQISLQFRYNTAIFRAGTIDQFAEHLTLLLEQSTQQPARAISDFSLLTSVDKQAIKACHTQSEEIPTLAYLSLQFEDIVTRHGDLIAYSDNEQTISYAILNSLSNQRARWLQDQGVSTHDRVAIKLSRGLNLLVSIIACLKIRAVYVPIDPSYPEARIQYIFSAAQSQLLIDDKTLIDDSTFDTTNLSFQGDKNDSACILFTSGSTGKPKGVDLPHRALFRLGVNNGFLSLNPGERIGYAANVAFDACNIEVWNALLNGATLVAIDDDTLLNSEALSRFLKQHALDALFLTTALFNLHAQHDPTLFSGLQTLMTGGEAMDQDMARRLIENQPDIALYNLYGPTENGTVSSFQRIDVQSLMQQPLPIGRAVNRSQIHIETPYGQSCPIGVTGEIVVAGEGLAKGYLHQQPPVAPFSKDDDGTLRYHTGDLGFLTIEGQIVYCGREDDQLKVRGFRIELGEIERQIGVFEGIKQACVICRHNDDKTPQIFAYFRADTPINLSQLKMHLRAQLPHYMQPLGLLQLPQLPLTQNGKIDKEALPAIQVIPLTAQQPSTEFEKRLAVVWCELLGLENISTLDNFFELGGHSLLAAKCAAKLTEELQQTVTLRDFFDHPTLADLSAHLAQNPQKILPPILPAKAKTDIPAGLSQQRLWFIQQMMPESFAYNMPLALRLTKPITEWEVHRALDTLIDRYDVLNLSFLSKDGVPYLQASPQHWALDVIDLSVLANTEKGKKSKRLLSAMARHSFDLNKGPLIQAQLIHLNDNESLLALCLHHISVDGLSIALLLKDLGQLLCGDKALGPKPALDYKDYCYYQQQIKHHDIFVQQIDFWNKALAESTGYLDLPLDYPRPQVPSFKGKTISIHLPSRLYAALKALSTATDSRLMIVLMAAYGILLSRYTRQDDLCIGFPVAGRQQHATQNMVGLFVNNLVMRQKIDGDQSIGDFLMQQQAQFVDVLANQDVPFDAVLETLDIERQTAYTPFLQASMQVETQSLEAQIQSAFDDSIRLERIEQHHAKYDLNLCCLDAENTLSLRFEFAADLFKETTIARMAQHYIQILEGFVAQTEQPIKSLNLLNTRDIQQHAIKSQPSPITPLVVERFEQVTRQFTEHTAINDEKGALSYQTLNEKSNQLAHYLLKQGIKSQDFIGISLNRSQEVVVSILATLKIGAIYVPIDPDSPEARKAFIAEDAGLSCIITDQTSFTDCLSIAPDAGKNESPLNPNKAIDQNSIAYMIYTSGTTGKPKGCLVSHRNLARLFSTTTPLFDFNAQDVWCLFHSYAFDFSVWEIFGALLHGAKLAIVPKAITRTPDRFYRFLAEEKITVLNQTPSAFSQLIMQDQSQSKPLHLKQVIFGGEALDYQALKPWVDNHALDAVKLTNMYGITETTVHASFHRITPSDIFENRRTIGVALPDMHLLILDQHLQLAPIGVKGEICVAGAGVTQGYHQRPELTAKRFIPSPFDPTIHLYRSGDLARQLPNGEIEYLGRLDRQVNIRGFRVELDEITAQLNNHHDVLESHVQISDTQQNPQLTAYCLVKDSNALPAGNIRTFLAEHLADYMLPQAIIGLEAWPLTTNGKIDTARLPKPTVHHFHRQTYSPPRNETEETLVEIWQSILGIEQVGITDNFFELGGHSLLATQVSAKVRSQLLCDLPLKIFFEKPTIEALAIHILEDALLEEDLDEEALLALLDEVEGG